jgi:hypothetical protein
MRLEEEGNARDKIVEWGIRNLHSMNELIRKIFWSSHTMSKTTSFYFHIRVPPPHPPHYTLILFQDTNQIYLWSVQHSSDHLTQKRHNST